MTIAVVGAAAGGALDAVVAACGEVDRTERWSPLAAPGWLARAPGAIGRYAERRRGPHDVDAPALLAVEAGLRAWAGGRTDRRYRIDFALRAAIDVWAAREVRRRRPRIVVASSLAARRTFAAARELGAATVLILDVPVLRALHRDLDRAAGAWPERGFLRRFRAPSWAIARQDAERVMADLVIVRGAYAHALCVADGIATSRLAQLPVRLRAVVPPAAPTGRLRLAGLAAARHGIDTALAAARQLGMTLVVRIGEGTEPADLAQQPGVLVERAGADRAADSGRTGGANGAGAPPGVDAIVCPAICESYPDELGMIGVPVIASPMVSRDGGGPDPYDARAFAAAIRGAPVAEPEPPLGPPLATLIAALR
ncbi:MAG TPA: hypothetical protein VH165_35110 [Kofleriaceae bacterium]|jgi:hypothetical protein|nr:hypothetical protein [Kofleriaceae bacterium]